MNEQNNHAALTIAQQYPPAQYNLLVPMQTVTEIADIQKPVMNSVSISTNLNDGEIYEMEKAKDEWRDSKGYVHKATPAKYALTKKGLTKLMRAAGIKILSSRPVVPSTCQNFIYAGIDVELSGGTQHFSLMPNDQTNIDSMFAAITLGASEYPYHPDGGKCVMYSAADIITLYSEYKSFVTKQTTYCNALRQWAKRETDPNVIGSIYYGCTLPEDLEKEVEGILSAAQAQIVAIINKLSA